MKQNLINEIVQGMLPQKVIDRVMIACELSLVTISKIHRQIFMFLQNKELPYFLLCLKVIL